MPSSFRVSLRHVRSFKGQRLSDEPGWSRYQGECAAGVQYVFYKGGKALGKTSTWRQGIKVRGGNVKPGTAIASFRNGRFKQDHAAVFVRESSVGLVVYDQYNNPRKAWGPRTLYFRSNNDRSNNGDLFYVIKK